MKHKKLFFSLFLYALIILSVPMLIHKSEAQNLDSIKWENVKIEVTESGTKIKTGSYNDVFLVETTTSNKRYLNIYFVWDHIKNEQQAIKDFKQLANKLIAYVDPNMSKEERKSLLYDQLQIEKVLNNGNTKATNNNIDYELINKGYHMSLIIREYY